MARLRLLATRCRHPVVGQLTRKLVANRSFKGMESLRKDDQQLDLKTAVAEPQPSEAMIPLVQADE